MMKRAEMDEVRRQFTSSNATRPGQIIGQLISHIDELEAEHRVAMQRAEQNHKNELDAACKNAVDKFLLDSARTATTDQAEKLMASAKTGMGRPKPEKVEA